MTKTWFIFLLARQEDITQSPLQLGGAIGLTSSQWDMSRNDAGHFKARTLTLLRISMRFCGSLMPQLMVGCHTMRIYGGATP